MMSNGNIFRITGPLWGKFKGHGVIPFTKAVGAELWWFIWSAVEQTFEQTVETPVISDATVLIMTPLQCFFLHEASRCKYFRQIIENCFMIYDCLSTVCLQNKWVLFHKLVSRTTNYAHHILRGVITGPWTALISAIGTPLLKWIPRNLFCGGKQAIYNEFRA